MAAVAVEPAPGLADYLTDHNAVLKDNAKWRYGRAPDYGNTRNVFEQTKTTDHKAESLPFLVQNLVKNWEVEASFKTDLADWRTIDRPNYSFAINGGPPQTGEHMLKVGTYNAIISEPNEFYSPRTSDFASSHKTFKSMMPTFAWEVLEVYSGPPQVSFRWRHWGRMERDYVGFNDKGEKITAPAHGGMIDIQGVTVAKVNDKVQLQKVETWFDPLEMFRQIAPKGIVNKEVVPPKTSEDRSPKEEEEEGEEGEYDETKPPGHPENTSVAGACPFRSLARHPRDMENEGETDDYKEALERMERYRIERDGLRAGAGAGAAVAATEGSEETRRAKEEMGKIRREEKEELNAE